jgi:hypothetical protein
VAFPYPILSGVGIIREFGRPDYCPIKAAFNENLLHRSSIFDNARKEQPAKEISRRHYGILEQEGRRFHYDATHLGAVHGARKGDGKATQQVVVGFRNRQPWSEARQNGVVPFDGFGKFIDIEEVTLPDRDASEEWP